MKNLRTLLKKLRISGVAGVDHPAHMHPGWAVMKSHPATSLEGVVAQVIEPARRELTEDAIRLEATSNLFRENQRELERIEQTAARTLQHQAETRSMLEEQIDSLSAIQKWVGSDFRKAEQSRPTSIDIGRSVWGLDS